MLTRESLYSVIMVVGVCCDGPNCLRQASSDRMLDRHLPGCTATLRVLLAPLLAAWGAVPSAVTVPAAVNLQLFAFLGVLLHSLL
jgi:hypothetical protein